MNKTFDLKSLPNEANIDDLQKRNKNIYILYKYTGVFFVFFFFIHT